VTTRFAVLSMLVTGATAFAVLLTALAFLPVADWASFVPIAVVVGGAGVLGAALSAGWAGAGLVAPADLHALRHAQGRLHRTLTELERDRGQMATIFQHMADGLLVLDSDERIELINPAAARLLHASETVGRPLAEVARDAELVEIARAAGGRDPVAQVIDIRAGSGAPRHWVQVVATQLPDGRRTLVLLQDVTDLRRAEAARRDFVANVSHELRTPVAALKALVETLQAGALDDPAVGPDFLRRMHVEVDGLAQLVTELLELARAEAGRLELECTSCLPGALLREAVERTRPYAERISLQLDLVDALSPDVTVEADPRRIGQVLSNLLANAVKFSMPGGRIVAGARALDGWVEFWVADTGVGIQADQLPRVFERFYKTDPSRAGAGTGLGLAICKHVVHAHGGEIWAASGGEGQGATFRFTLRQSGASAVPGSSDLKPPNRRRPEPAVAAP
jgi:two-component system phosphate regulon sensor histidine kinase PhoR